MRTELNSLQVSRRLAGRRWDPRPNTEQTQPITERCKMLPRYDGKSRGILGRRIQLPSIGYFQLMPGPRCGRRGNLFHFPRFDFASFST
jgi:hypothetical protein